MIAVVAVMVSRDGAMSTRTAALVMPPLIERLGDPKYVCLNISLARVLLTSLRYAVLCGCVECRVNVAAAEQLTAIADLLTPAFALDQLALLASPDRGPKLVRRSFAFPTSNRYATRMTFGSLATRLCS
jgi:hypothetical protein